MKEIHIPRMHKGGVKVIISPLTWDGKTYFGELKRALKSLDITLSEIKKNSDEVILAKKTSDIYTAKTEGKISMLLGLEGGKPLEGEIAFLRIFYELGLRYLGFTWNYRNQLADGVGARAQAGLTDFGKDVVKEANKLGILLDVSHLNEKGFWDVINLTNEPVMASHSNVRAICDHPRNLTDKQIEAIVEKGGVIGINFFHKYLPSEINRKTTLSNVLDHIDYIINLVGIDYVGLGPDYMDYSLDLVEKIKGVPPNLIKDEWLFALVSSDVSKYPEGLENITKLPNLIRGLIERGYSDNEIQKILGLNFMRLINSIIG